LADLTERKRKGEQITWLKAKGAEVDFQFRDIRAKTATDTDDLARSQQLLGHKTRAMTEHYTRNRRGEKVEPLK
jgi:hypothetical protein